MDEPIQSNRPEIPPIERLGRILLVGLGNPGSRYARTRHNVGFFTIDDLASKERVSLSQVRFKGQFGEGVAPGKRLFFLKPQTFMNLSGQSVSQACRYLNLEPGGLVVIHDDIDLPLGKIRVKWAGSAGGHRGLVSIDRELGRPDYFRIRIGVGRPQDSQVVEHVLSGFRPEEVEVLGKVIEGAARAAQLLITQGLRVAQNLVNGMVFSAAGPQEVARSSGLKGDGTDR
ncbi:MAG: aminoacyl-tRNA hydrolase [Bradymonadales bacterium]|nr:aminoacyl-tRNA hydrolase [Bradymonadales bacterium]